MCNWSNESNLDRESCQVCLALIADSASRVHRSSLVGARSLASPRARARDKYAPKSTSAAAAAKAINCDHLYMRDILCYNLVNPADDG